MARINDAAVNPAKWSKMNVSSALRVFDGEQLFHFKDGGDGAVKAGNNSVKKSVQSVLADIRGNSETEDGAGQDGGNVEICVCQAHTLKSMRNALFK